MTKPKVVLFSTGGTIASLPREGEGYAPALSGRTLLESAINWSSAIAEVEDVEFAKAPGQNLTLDLIMDLACEVNETLARPEVVGVVVTEGTAVIEEAPYLVDLFLRGSKPAVFTGAQLNAAEAGADGPRNLLHSIRVAIHPEAQDKGVFVVGANQIHAARDMIKGHRSHLSAFSSLDPGPLGLIEPDDVVFLRAPRGRITFPEERIERNVDVVTVTIDCDDRHIRASLAAGARGIVIEAFPGRGSVTPAIMEGIRTALAEGVVVVLSSRVPGGRCIPGYGGGTGSTDMAHAGVIMGGDLTPAKARVLLMATLAHCCDINEIREVFRRAAP